MKTPDYFWRPYHPLALLLWPLSLMFRIVAGLRRTAYRRGLLTIERAQVPVVVIGNISVGGTGKTPLIVWAARQLRQSGLRPGIVARGYGGRGKDWPCLVTADSDPRVVGDEPVLIADRTGCPMAVGPDRVAAVRLLLHHHRCDLVLSDDGLQHYALGRDLEIAVIDGERRLGNGMPLPAGPLREGPWRLKTVDMVVANGNGADGEYSMSIEPGGALNLLDGRPAQLSSFSGLEVHAVAGIGNPGRFFRLLEKAGLAFEAHVFPDHHDYRPEDLLPMAEAVVLMTEKDAVKCRAFARPNWWYIPVDAVPEAAFVNHFTRRVEELVHGQETARNPGLSRLQG